MNFGFIPLLGDFVALVAYLIEMRILQDYQRELINFMGETSEYWILPLQLLLVPDILGKTPENSLQIVVQTHAKLNLQLWLVPRFPSGHQGLRKEGDPWFTGGLFFL